jgi:transcriptional regulator with GAF, ATPase, and Fis domain
VVSPSRRTPSCPYLFRLVECESPLVPSSRHLLKGLDRVFIGRGPRTVERAAMGPSQELRLAVPDPRMSATHARLRRVLGGWLLEDDGSRNGTFIKGVRIERHPLRDGDIFETGHTSFLFRLSLPLVDDEPPDLDASKLDRRVRGLATLSPALTHQLQRLAQVAPSSVEVLILGETGTGKELIASAVATLSGREGSFVAVNCATLPPNLVESELFGYHRGAFSGAEKASKGVVRSANGGTLFLDEIGELPLGAQAALLRVLQERQVMSIGSTELFPVDFRLCSATNRSLDELVSQGRFRADLLMRIRGFTLELPPLRQRREDFGLLLGTLLERVDGERAGTVSFTKEAMRALLRYDWPGNVRELEKCLETAMILAMERAIGLDELPRTLLEAVSEQETTGGDTLDPSDLSPEEQRHCEELIALLKQYEGNLSEISRVTGKDRVQLRRWMRRYRIDPDHFRPGGPKGRRR